MLTTGMRYISDVMALVSLPARMCAVFTLVKTSPMPNQREMVAARRRFVGVSSLTS